MLHRIFMLTVALIVVILTVGCSLAPAPATKTPLASPSPGSTSITPIAALTPTPIPQLMKLVGYNYQLKDVGDGWNEGRLSIALENISDQVIGNIHIDAGDAIVETKESKSYPISLYRLNSNTSDGSPVQDIDFGTMPKVIPPHFRWTRVGRAGELIGQYYVKFRAATAAHPTRIVFPRMTNLSIDLANAAQTSLAFPADASAFTAKPISALAGKVLNDDPDALQVTLDGTGAVSDQTVQLRYTVLNRDKLDAHTTTVAFPIQAFFFADGAVWSVPPNTTSESITVGPGQTAKKTLSLGAVFMDKRCNPNLYALLQESSQNVIYKLSFCK
jgi:hypothetical protein